MAADEIKEIPPSAILDFDDPDVGIEFHLARQIGLDRSICCRPLFEAKTEGAIGIAYRVEFALWRRTEQFRGAVKPVDANEYGSGVLGAAPAHHRGEAFDLAATKIGGNPKSCFQTHRPRYASIQEAPQTLLFEGVSGHGTKLADKLVRNPAAERQLVVTLEFFDSLAGRYIQHTGGLDLAVAVFGQNALHRCYGGRRADEIGNRIIAPCRRRNWQRHRCDLLLLTLCRSHMRRRQI